jgi:DNA polymerase-3 subunit delta'
MLTFLRIFAYLKQNDMQFKDIAGQRDVINRLTEIIDSGRVSHAQLFLGATADGSLQLALAYLQYLCCEHRQHYDGGELRADSCGECPSCKKLAQLMHPDLHLIFPNAATSKVSGSSIWSGDFMADFRDFVLQHNALGTLDEWYATLGTENKQGMIRELDASHIVSDLALKSYEGGWKMMVIWMAEKMNIAAANELLKTLEEPTPGTLLLLVAESDERLLSTIRSRVQTVRLKPADSLQAAAGSEEFAKLLVEWLRLLFKLKMKELSAQVDRMAAMNREQQKQFLGYALGVMRDCFLHGAAGLPVDIGSGDQKFDAMFPQMVTVNNIELINTALNEALFALERNANAKIALMQLSFSMSMALKKR